MKMLSLKQHASHFAGVPTPAISSHATTLLISPALTERAKSSLSQEVAGFSQKGVLQRLNELTSFFPSALSSKCKLVAHSHVGQSEMGKILQTLQGCQVQFTESKINATRDSQSSPMSNSLMGDCFFHFAFTSFKVRR